MKRLSIKTLTAVAMVATTLITNAKTVAWYRFEEGTASEVTTGETVFLNSVDPAKHPAYPRVNAATASNQYNPVNPTTLTTDPDHMPQYVRSLPDGIAVLDPQYGEYATSCALDFRNNPQSWSNPSGSLIIPDHENLRLQTLTIECFVKIPSFSWEHRSFFMRAGSAYDNLNAPFRIDGSLSKTFNNHVSTRIPVDDGTGAISYSNAHYTATYWGKLGLDDGLWHHLALVIDGASKTSRIYFDYAEGATVRFEGELNYEEGYPIVFGSDLQCTYYNSQMVIDEIRISDEALPPKKMLQYKHVSDLAGTVRPDTLFYLPFTGSMEPVTYGAGEMASPVTVIPFLENKAVNPAYSGVNATLWSPRSTANNPVDPVPSVDVPSPIVRQGLTALETETNPSSCQFTTNGVAAADCVKGVVLPESVTWQDLFADDLTVECDFKMPAGGVSVVDDVCLLLSMCNGFAVQSYAANVWCYGYLEVSIGDTKLQSASGGVMAGKFADDKWHHMALVYKKSQNRGEFYVDNVLRLWSDAVSMTGTRLYQKNFMMGSSYWGGPYYCTSFGIDEVRVTRGALRPYEFLTTKACEGSDLAYAAFDGDYLISPYADFFTAATAVGGAFDADRPARLILNGKDGDPVRAKNAGSVSLSDGSVTWPGHDIVTDSSTVTTEFFVKTSVSGAPLLTVGDLWSLDSSLNLIVGAEAAQPMAGAGIADGLWHHVAVVFDDADAKVYVDYEPVLEHTFAAALPTAQAADLVLGGTGFSGKVDELRFTPFVLGVDEFLHTLKKGMTLILR